MKNSKSIGICMDHASAHLIEVGANPMETSVITSTFTHQSKTQSLNKGESLMHQKEQHEQAAYYKLIGEKIIHFDTVLLFGPTSAKVELYNILKQDHRFAAIHFEIKQTDKMTENQEAAFVREFFSEDLVNG